MPYVKPDVKAYLDRGGAATSAGELNYKITKLLLDFVETKGLSYATINDCVGALVSAKDEFNRRVTTPYEEKKISENGDVYEGLIAQDRKGYVR